MVFNVNQFKSTFDKYDGPSRTNLFMVELIPTSTNQNTMPARDIRFFCKSVQVPGINLNLAVRQPYGIGLPQSFPTGLTSEMLNCVFILDSQHQILSFFHKWMQSIVNFDVSRGLLAPNANDYEHYPYEINYREDYEMRMVIRYYANTQSLYNIVLDGVYPSELSSINLSWEDNDQIANLPVNFSYREINVDSTRTGEVQNDSSRGLLGLTSSIESGNGIQRAIDAYSSVPPTPFSSIPRIGNSWASTTNT